ncbi:type 2 lanthipeptide synthetase LanM [Enterococcus faecalis]
MRTLFYHYGKAVVDYVYPEWKIEISKKIEKYTDLKIIENLENKLIGDVVSTSLYCLIEEVHIFSEENTQLNEKEAYDMFDFSFFQTKNVETFFNKYVILEDKIRKKINYSIVYFIEIIEHFHNDKEYINKHFSANHQKIKKIHFGNGDTHSKGKTVCTVETDYGKLMYKPHTLYNNLFFTRILKFIKNEAELEFIDIPVYTRDHHGWQKFIVNEEITSPKSYYEKMGHLLGLAYFLTMTDLHYENIFVKNNSPVVIDLETMFSNYSPNTSKVNKALGNSVLGTAILPWNPKEVYHDIDTSAIFGLKRYRKFRVPKELIVNEFTANIYIDNTEVTLGENCYDKNFIDPLNHINDIIYGFSTISNKLLKIKEKLLMFLESEEFNKITNRIVLRDTQVYYEFINASIHPKYLQNAESQDNLFDILMRNSTESEKEIKRTEAEILSLRRMDIPYFEISSLNTSLFSDGQIVTNKYFGESFLENLKKHIQNIDDNQIKLQIGLIKKSFLLPSSNIYSNEKINKNNVITSELDYKSQAEIIIQSILEESLLKVEDDYYLMQLVNSEECVFLSPTGHSLYDGLGIILTVLSYGYLNNNKYYMETATKLIKQLLPDKNHIADYIEAYGDEINVSAYNGIGSLVYIIYNFYKATKEQFFKELFYEIIKVLNKISLNNKDIEYLNGYSSTVLLISNLLEEIEDDKESYLLMEVFSKLEVNFYNNYKSFLRSQDTIGLAHGADGLAIAVACFYKHSRNQIWLVVLNNMFISSKRNNFTTNRNSWCRGLSGHIFAWDLISKKLVDIEEAVRLINSINNVIDENKKLVLKDIWNVNGFSLCHGLMGNILIIDRLFNGDCNLVSSVIDKVDFTKPSLGIIYSNLENESLMIGKSGLVLALLNIHFCNAPNPLCLSFLS